MKESDARKKNLSNQQHLLRLFLPLWLLLLLCPTVETTTLEHSRGDDVTDWHAILLHWMTAGRVEIRACSGEHAAS